MSAIIDLLEQQIGLEVKESRRSGWADCICPIHPERHPSFSINEESGAFICRHEGITGYSAKLIYLVTSMPYEQAKKLVEEVTERILDTEELLASLFPEPDHAKVNLDLLEWKARYDKLPTNLMPKYWFSRGFTAETATRFEVRYDQTERALVWPVRNEGQLIGVAQRYVYDARPKYRYNLGFERLLYPLPQWTNQGQVILVEGPLDALWMHQAGYSEALCLFGSQFSPEQATWVRRHAGEVCCLFDNDREGIMATRQVLAALPDLHVRVGRLPSMYHDPQETPPEELGFAVAFAKEAWEITER